MPIITRLFWSFSNVYNEITKGLKLGLDPQKTIDAVAAKMNSSKYNAGRLVMTEEAYFSSLARGDCFRDLGVQQFEIVATLDDRTSEICQDMDGKIFPMSVYKPGTTAPPFHVWCRSTTAPYYGNSWGDVGERAARDPETGKTYYVRGDMTYGEWKSKFVKNPGGSEADYPKLVSGGSAANKAGTKAEPAEIKGVSTGHNVGNTGKVYKDEKIDFSGRKNVDNSGGSGIIGVGSDKMAEIIKLGTLNTQPLEKEFGKLKTNEIIVTNERIDHIKNRHPEDYELFEKYGVATVTNPDLIIKDCKNENTVFMIKKLDETNLNVVTKLILDIEENELINSVMTFYRIRERNLIKLEKKNKMLYKKE